MIFQIFKTLVPPIKYCFQKFHKGHSCLCYSNYHTSNVLKQRRRGDGKMAYDVLEVSRHVINYSNKKGYGISNLKLQKILYFIQAYFLSYTNSHDPCFIEKIEAWDFGPVIPRAYCEYKQYGSGNIPPVSWYRQFDSDSLWSVRQITYHDDCISTKDKKLIDAVIDKFKDYSATDLVSLTHKQSPWKDAYVPYENREITKDAIREFFGTG